jgi:dTDP-4-amino-4,6-dideoxygalactose transaminase
LSVLAINGGKPVRTKSFPKWPVYDESEIKALNDVLESGLWGIGGKKVPEFEQKFCHSHDTKYGISTVNGTLALTIALLSAGIGNGDEVIIPSYTFMATASSVMLANAVPIFADVDPETYCIDPKDIKRVITKNTKAIIPVYLGGQIADMDEISRIAKENNLIVIEDACQAHFAEWNGKKAGSIADLGCFSFQSSKNMTSGEGGIIITNDERLANNSWSIHNCGRTIEGAWYEHPYLGWNIRMTEFQAALLLEQLKRAEHQIEIRNINAKYFTEVLDEIDGISPLHCDERVSKHSYHLFIVKYDKEMFGGIDKNKFIKVLNAEGIPCARGYVPIHREGYLKDAQKYGYASARIDYSKISCPVSERACDEEAVWFTQNVLLGDTEDIDSIIDSILKVKNNINELV